MAARGVHLSLLLWGALLSRPHTEHPTAPLAAPPGSSPCFRLKASTGHAATGAVQQQEPCVSTLRLSDAELVLHPTESPSVAVLESQAWPLEAKEESPSLWAMGPRLDWTGDRGDVGGSGCWGGTQGGDPPLLPACPLPKVSMMPILSPQCHRCALSPQGRFWSPSPPMQSHAAFGERSKSSLFCMDTGKSQLSPELRLCP